MKANLLGKKIAFYVLIIVVWQGIDSADIWPDNIFPSPIEVGEDLLFGLSDGSLLYGIGTSMWRLIIGLAIAIGGGMLLGIFMARVETDLDENLSAIDLFKATFPAGTVSGAPKVRAMEIIDEFEPVKRGIYGGAVGYLSWQGNMDMAIAIRTAIIKDEVLYIQAGGGWVADSLPDLEWKESLNKGRAIFKAAEMVQEKLEG